MLEFNNNLFYWLNGEAGAFIYHTFIQYVISHFDVPLNYKYFCSNWLRLIYTGIGNCTGTDDILANDTKQSKEYFSSTIAHFKFYKT